MNRLAIFAAAAALLAAASPALAAETIAAVFTAPDGGVTAGTYSGTVKVTVSGVGQSLGANFNDAFYLYSPAFHDANYYQLTFGTSALVGFAPAQNAVNFIVGGLPAYQASHVYSFLLNTGTVVPKQLHFGVGDGAFHDNSGAYSVTVASIPEPAAWGLVIGGFALTGLALRRRTAALAA